MPHDLKQAIESRARAAGFDAVGFTTPDAVAREAARLDRFLAAGRHGTMDWMAAHADRRRDPQTLWPDARSVIVLGLNYGPQADPLDQLGRPDKAVVSVYARGGDYHDLVKNKLKAVARWLAAEAGAEVKVFVDTAPVMEKPLAAAAGIGWQGKHTNLVSRDLGSWLFLGEIFTTAAIAPDEPEADHCGTCRKCLDVCPTDAFPAPYQLDARRCVSYLTIEHKGHIPRDLRPGIGNRVYGCDDCLAVCPWNKFAQASREAKLAARDDLDAPDLGRLLALDDAAFRARFAGSPIKRTGRDRFVRNCLIAAGNSGDTRHLPQVERLLDDPAPVVRAMAVWALRRLADRPAFDGERARRMPSEPASDVRGEWAAE
jgi:epoxyqueuosine reductase